jgi:hypothetical protein
MYFYRKVDLLLMLSMGECSGNIESVVMVHFVLMYGSEAWDCMHGDIACIRSATDEGPYGSSLV